MQFEFRDYKYPVIARPKPGTRVYLRYGLWGGMRKSTNAFTGVDEAGISVCPATLDESLAVVPVEHECSDFWRRQLSGQGRLCFAVTGREVGVGSDGEPILVGVKILPYAIHRSAAIY